MQNKNKSSSLIRTVLIGLVLGPGIMLAASILLAFVALKTGNPTSSVFPMALLSIFLGGLISSIWATRQYKEKPVQAGLLTGLGNLIIVIIVALISSPFSGDLWNAMLPPAMLAGSSLLGTIIAARIKPSTKRKLKKLRKQAR